MSHDAQVVSLGLAVVAVSGLFFGHWFALAVFVTLCVFF